MDQQEIDRIVEECKKVTEKFRAKLKPVTDESEEKKLLSTDVKLLVATSDQIHRYIQQIQNLIQSERKESLSNLVLVNLSGLYVTGDVKITGELPSFFCTGTTFEKKVDFSSVVFNSFVHFYGTTFNSRTLFSNVVFKSSALFGDFLEMTNSKRTTFEKEVDFSGALFKEKANFSSVAFNSWAHFSNAVFKKGAYFSSFPIVDKFLPTTYQQKLNFSFSSVIFYEASFYNVTFEGMSNFSHVTFLSRADFRKANFEKKADFPLSQASFHKATFNEQVDFSDTNFNVLADFSGATFDAWTNFFRAVFDVWVDYSKTTFKKEVSFNSVEFKNSTYFSECAFNNAPLFHETTLHQDTSFEGTQFLRCETEEDYRAYRTLKQHMSDVHAKLEENMFFALEQRTRQYLDIQEFKKGKIELFPAIVISKFYEGISEYGQSLFKPIWQLFALWAIFSGIFILPNMVAVNQEVINKPVNSWFSWMPAGYGYSTQNVFNPLGAINIFNSDKVFYPLNMGIAAMGWLEAILSLAIITLWLLAVRRRFQKGE